MTTTREARIQVANTILKQLGGNRFKVMTGSYNFVAGENALHMRLRRNKTSANVLIITLNSKDLYTMEFKRITSGRFNSKTMTVSKPTNKTIEKFEDIYFDQLEDIFTQVTSLYTKL